MRPRRPTNPRVCVREGVTAGSGTTMLRRRSTSTAAVVPAVATVRGRATGARTRPRTSVVPRLVRSRPVPAVATPEPVTADGEASSGADLPVVRAVPATVAGAAYPVGGATSGGGRAAAAERPDPATGRGIFQGREETPPRGNLGGQGSRWGTPREKRDRRAPERRPRPAPAPSADRGRRDGEGSWLTGSGKRNDNAPITPFWGEGGSGGPRDRKRDVPFWLSDD